MLISTNYNHVALSTTRQCINLRKLLFFNKLQLDKDINSLSLSSRFTLNFSPIRKKTNQLGLVYFLSVVSILLTKLQHFHSVKHSQTRVCHTQRLRCMQLTVKS